MTKEELKGHRKTLGLTQRELARWLKLSDGRTVRKWEAGDRPITGPVQVAVEAFESGFIPGHIRIDENKKR